MGVGPNDNPASADWEARREALQRSVETMMAEWSADMGPCWEDHEHDEGECTHRVGARPASWVMITEWVDLESGDYRYVRITNDGLPEHARVGLIEVCREMG